MKTFRVATAAVLVTLLLSGAGRADADPKQADARPLFSRQNQAGVRLGVWNHGGADVPDSIGITVNDEATGGSVMTNLKSASFYLEGFYLYRFNAMLAMEFAGGTINRGSVTITDSSGRSDIGNLILYPITVQARYFPLVLGGKIHPWVSGGIGMYVGRRTVQFTDSPYFDSNWKQETEVDFTYVLSAGFDWPLADQVGLDFQTKFMPINFDKRLLTINDYSAIAVTVGIKYLYGK
ncbi:MAG: hypothetical protein ABIE70_02550 [bacterium]